MNDPGEIPGDLKGLIVHLGFSRSDLDELLDGEVIQLDEDLKEGSKKEMAVSVAVILPASLDKAVKILRGGRSFEIDSAVLEYGKVGAPAGEADFARLGYTPSEWEEVESLLEVEGGSAFNFSGEEIERFQRLARRLHGRSPKKDASVRQAANALLRAVLLERCLAYQEGGIAKLAPYDRGDEGQTRPSRELRAALREDLTQDARLTKLARGFLEALVHYPDPLPEGYESEFFWTKLDVDDRPCFTLTHRMFRNDTRGALVADRQFYVGHSYNSSHVVMGAFPTEHGTLVFYRNRTSTDQVAGRVGRAKKALGRRRLRNTIVDYLESVRRLFDERPFD